MSKQDKKPKKGGMFRVGYILLCILLGVAGIAGLGALVAAFVRLFG